MRSRPRDFVYTVDDLFFATTSYLHPRDRIIAFLRYIPDPGGERSRDGRRYSKVDSEGAYRFLEENYPTYLYEAESIGKIMLAVPHELIEEIMTPTRRLKEIMEEGPSDELLEKVLIIADAFHEEASISFDDMGVSGSILPSLHDPENSDIDFVIYGLENHRKALEAFAQLKDHGPFKSLSEDYWLKVYKKRIKDNSLSFEEFCWYEERKNNRGLVDGTLFDILATRSWDEIEGSWSDTVYEPLGRIKIKARVYDAMAAFDNPAIYKVEDVSILEGPRVDIDEVVSFTHTYAGQAKEGEMIIAKGVLERYSGAKEGYRVVVGTTREALNEYIKVNYPIF
ncbi:MAG TPA: DNA polymerase subunit beta [Methanothermobacter sp.]|jgi:predicted nucleotidyltransferase|uniref:DNA polymerase subunit beta n=1 Tax=Methanothermobacter tenebrarum TaxID=680118 RepID=A0ABN6PDV4_9EURY|nr:DNA polymerase subunit beta [Methanothermobacter tenebrarum]MDX9694122.1 DNA polymerase subunit beta [Methanothermobacter sp.]BDH78816.1 DNA polymerase subunit beta [Methanothermobacter tenebrarum]HHW17026.1 DNA polymerase subunit beta [Methanothermobacter sp.]HOQ19820.1 DNA polymerase subunit beta [Methanothermobacter sp.]